MHAEGVGRHAALGVEIALEGAAGRQVVEQFDATDLDNPVAGGRIETRRLGIDNDLTHAVFTCCVSKCQVMQNVDNLSSFWIKRSSSKRFRLSKSQEDGQRSSDRQHSRIVNAPERLADFLASHRLRLIDHDLRALVETVCLVRL